MYPFRLYFRHPFTLIALSAGLALNLASWFWLVWNISRGEQVFLHYTILFGIDEVGQWGRMFFVPLAGLGILAANSALSWLLFQRERFMAQALQTAAFLAQILVFLHALLIVALNV